MRRTWKPSGIRAAAGRCSPDNDGISREDGNVARVRSTRSLLSLVLAVALAVPLGLLAPSTAQAKIDNGDFLRRGQVRAMMEGMGRWESHTARVTRPIKVKPAGCMFDDAMGSYRQARGRMYWGQVRGAPATEPADVGTEVYRYGTRKAAKKAMRRLKRYPAKCPRSVRVWCEDCDGIDHLKRRPATLARVGRQSTAWRLRQSNNWLAKGYVVSARKGRTIVVSTVLNWRDPTGPESGYPKAPSKSKTVTVAKAALKKAT